MSNYSNPIRLHLTRYDVNAERYVDAFAVGNHIEGFGVRHIVGKKGYRVLAKYDGKVWELHQNKNSDYFKILARSENKAVRRELWAPKDTDKWLSDDLYIALAELSYRN